mmetsp:Transcript_163157/g.523210  ORF Transcript_163157/g.523210 Transcript_163157/m.523210 type:complete len:297 (+) Transcript_163157:603-1493(+)
MQAAKQTDRKPQWKGCCSLRVIGLSATRCVVHPTLFVGRLSVGRGVQRQKYVAGSMDSQLTSRLCAGMQCTANRRVATLISAMDVGTSFLLQLYLGAQKPMIRSVSFTCMFASFWLGRWQLNLQQFFTQKASRRSFQLCWQCSTRGPKMTCVAGALKFGSWRGFCRRPGSRQGCLWRVERRSRDWRNCAAFPQSTAGTSPDSRTCSGRARPPPTRGARSRGRSSSGWPPPPLSTITRAMILFWRGGNKSSSAHRKCAALMLWTRMPALRKHVAEFLSDQRMAEQVVQLYLDARCGV